MVKIKKLTNDEIFKKLSIEEAIKHIYISIRFILDRGISHEIVRHRLASYAQESTRYCNYSSDKFGKEIIVIKPPNLDLTNELIWKIACETAEKSYLDLIDKGVKPQIARAVLPTCLKTEIVVTANLLEWRHILKLRLAPDAHPQMRELMGHAKIILDKAAPTVFNNSVTYV